MVKLPEIDFNSFIKISRKNRKFASSVVDKIREMCDGKWWSFDETNIFSGSTIVFNYASKVKLYPVTLGLNEDLYKIQFIVNNDGIIAKALKADNSNNIENIMSSAESFNRTLFNNEIPKKIRLRLNSKKYLKFLNNVEAEAKHLLVNLKLAVTKENVCLVLTIAFMCNNYLKYVDLDYSEPELVAEFFKRFHAGLSPEVALTTIVEGVSFEDSLKYAGVPASWVEEITGLNFKLV